MLTVERVQALQGREDLHSPWRELLARQAHRNLFLTPEWITTWWEHFSAGRDLWLLVVREGGRVIGLAPMTVTREFDGRMPARILGFMRNRHISRSDFIIPERRREVIRALVEFWREQARHWDVLRLEGVPAESDSLALAAEELAGCGLDPLPVRPRRTLDYLPVSEGWEDYLRSRSHRSRKNLRMGRKALERAGTVEYLHLTAPEEVRRTMEWLFDLEASSWKAGASGVAFDERDKRFHVALADRFAPLGGVENRFLRLNGRIVAALHSFVYDQVLYLLLTYYDPAYAELSPGRDLIHQTLNDCWQAGKLRAVDFNGSSPFIRHWTESTRPLGALSAHNRRLYSQVISSLKKAKRFLRGGLERPRAVAAPADPPLHGTAR